MAKSKERLAAVILRRKGASIKEIAKILNVSRGSVSVWCKEVKLTEKQIEKLREKQIAAGHKGRLMGVEANKQKKLSEVSKQLVEAKKLVGRLSARDRLMLGIGLYWGEGVKVDTSATALVNSSPDILLFAKEWFLNLGVDVKDLNPYIYISESHKLRESKILFYWSHLLGLPKSQFHKITYIKGVRKKLYENHDSYYGIVALRVRKGTSLKYKIRGLIECCKSRRSSGS